MKRIKITELERDIINLRQILSNIIIPNLLIIDFD